MAESVRLPGWVVQPLLAERDAGRMTTAEVRQRITELFELADEARCDADGDARLRAAVDVEVIPRTVDYLERHGEGSERA